MTFTRAIVRQPCRNIVDGLTEADLGPPDYRIALIQHTHYIATLKVLGLEITVLTADDNFPDSTFVEDTALLTPACAIITHPGALSRRGEVDDIEHALRNFYKEIEHIMPPGTIDAGDIMMVGSHFYIGLSDRTSREGADQMTALLEKYGLTGSTIPIDDVLHLKAAAAYLENNVLVVTRALADHPDFREFDKIIVDENEAYAANCVWINGTVLVADGFPKLKAAIEAKSYPTIALEMSEFQKLDGGLSCLSLRF
jgi:dimethylargininase